MFFLTKSLKKSNSLGFGSLILVGDLFYGGHKISGRGALDAPDLDHLAIHLLEKFIVVPNVMGRVTAGSGRY